MVASLQLSHAKQYKDLAALLWKYGRSDLVKRAGLDDYADEQATDTKEARAEAHQLTNDLEKMGPTYIKLGQLLSTRPDLIPPAYTKALARLQDKVEPFDFKQVEEIISRELGVKISRAFTDLDPTPIAAASLGQVHKATLRDGRPVAVKVQRPGIREQMIEDLNVLHEVSEFLDKHTEAGRRAQFVQTLNEFRRMLLRELDYETEAQNQRTLAKNLASFPRLIVPQPVDDYCTSRVLTMEFISGQKLPDLSPVVRLEIDGAALADQLFAAYLQGILVDGFFHADPHPGNILLTQDSKIALLDAGMVARISSEMQEDLMQLVLALADGRSDDATQFALKNGTRLDDFNEQELRRRVADLVGRHAEKSEKRPQLGGTMLEIRKIAEECGIRLPPELSLIGKTLLNLDGIGQCLAPDFDPNTAIKKHVHSLLNQRMLKSLSPSNILSRALEMKDFAQRLPGRVNRIMDAVANNELKVTVDAIDEKYLMAGFQKVANRITLGLILASLIIGAALLMRIETPFRILGYPGLAILFFLAAAIAGCILCFHILFHDEAAKKEAK